MTRKHLQRALTCGCFSKEITSWRKPRKRETADKHVREVKAVQGLQVIEVKKHDIICRKRKQRDQATKGIVTIAFVSLALNMVQAVVIYILQAGPI